MRVRKTIIITAMFALLCPAAFAQLYPERRLIRSGNREFEKGDYARSEVDYLRAAEKNPASYEAAFNLSDTRYKQERYEESAKSFGEMAAMEQMPPQMRADAYFNQGNALFQQKKLEEALEAYKNAMRMNPADQEAKFNYAYTKKLLDKNDDRQQNDDQNQDQNQDQNKDQNQNQDQENKNDQNQNDQNEDQNNDNNDPQDGEQQQNPQGGMSQEEAEQMLDAIQGAEDDTREKMDAQKAAAVAPSGKNW